MERKQKSEAYFRLQWTFAYINAHTMTSHFNSSHSLSLCDDASNENRTTIKRGVFLMEHFSWSFFFSLSFDVVGICFYVVRIFSVAGSCRCFWTHTHISFDGRAFVVKNRYSHSLFPIILLCECRMCLCNGKIANRIQTIQCPIRIISKTKSDF